ncbi:MAG: YlxR family protein [Pseudomonadota bacterium]
MGKGKGHIPIRTCLSCGRKAGKSELVRFVLDERGCLCRDERMRLPGRGAYVCKNRSCLEKMIEGGFRRACRGRKVVEMDPVLCRSGMKDNENRGYESP